MVKKSSRGGPGRKAADRGYLHGYSEKEQQRLYHQARFLEQSVFEWIDYPVGARVLEVGSGVGAQTEILLERFPQISVDCVDISPEQIQAAKKHLAPAIKKGQITAQVGSVEKLPFEDDRFDGTFICWFLEHLKDPVDALREVRRVMKARATIYCSEVFNGTFFVNPYSPATLQYWFQFNDHQWSLGGDPFAGAKLGNYLLRAGFQNVETRVVNHHFDNRAPKQRAQFIDEWSAVLLSGAPELIRAGRISVELVEDMKKELERLKHDPDSVFFSSFVQAKAQAF